MRDWTVIASYLKKEAGPAEVDHFNLLADRCPDLRDELEVLGREINTSSLPLADAFNATLAFEKLTVRFKEENLI